jgi:diadenosine tetraphosphate (Ap4A) HIT family hydrolase
MTTSTCPLCADIGGTLVFKNQHFRIILADDTPDYPIIVRIIWQEHHAELTDLTPDARNILMNAVWTVETSLHSQLQPDKINLASLGNIVPHIHWHLIPRFKNDPHFPAPIWGEKQREPNPSLAQQLRAAIPNLTQNIQEKLQTL